MSTLFLFCTLLSLAGWVFWRHSFFAVPFVVCLSITVEDFFPLSHFPMYSDPNNHENYWYLAALEEDGETTPLPVRRLTSITAPKVKKMYKSWSRDLAARLGKRDRDLTAEERAQVGRELIAFLQDQAARRGRELPPSLALVEVWIVHDDEEGFSETPEVVATVTPDAPVDLAAPGAPDAP